LLAPESWLGLHIAAGYAIGLLLVFRLVWGVFGSHHSRFASFLFAPRSTLAHLTGLIRLRPPHYLGHNPSGALMIFTLIGVLLALVATGLIELGGEEKQGPLAAVVHYATANALKPVHRGLAYGVMMLVALHVLGVLVEGRLTRMPLIRAMINGRKPVAADVPLAHLSPARPRDATVALATILLPLIGGLVLLSRLPALGVPNPASEPLLVAECGACHGVFHPSLLPRAAWAELMRGLLDHFGEDASLSPEAAQRISAYLSKNAAEAWDTEAAHRFLAVSADQPKRITATPGWRATHAKLDPQIFDRPTIRARSNCGACHRDAESGRFDDQAIHSPGATP
jgi:cytochrome b